MIESKLYEWPETSLTTAADRVRGFGQLGAHLATGYAAFDQLTRGGPRLRNLIVMGGAPGTGKTTLLCNIALAYAKLYPVAILAADEDADGLLIRMGQALGFARERLENGEATTLEALARKLESDYPNLMIGDASEAQTIESMTDALLVRAKGEPCMLFVDSIQTAPCEGTRDAKSAKERADTVVAALKHSASRGSVVFATCELNRGSYRSNDPEQRVADMAAFKESGGIEYGATVALIMRTPTDLPDQVDISIAKNRLGAKGEFRLHLDRVTATLAEVAKPPAEHPDAVRARELKDVCDRVCATVRAHPAKLATKNQVATFVGGRKARTLEALDVLEVQGKLRHVGGFYALSEMGRTY